MKVTQRSDRLGKHGALAVFVSFDEPASVRRLLLTDIRCPWPLLIDTDREAYRAWGLRRASFRQLWMDPNLYRQYTRLLRGGERIRGSGSDTRQLGGDFIVDSHGRIAYSRPQRRDDRPPVGVLLRALEGTAR